MRFSSDLLWTDTHNILFLLIFIAITALIIGRYKIWTIIKSTFVSFFIFSVMLTAALLFFAQERLYREEVMIDVLDENYEEKQKAKDPFNKYPEMVAAVSTFSDKDESIIEIWAANYNEEKTFKGDLRILFYKDNEIKDTKTYKITIGPEEKKQIETFESDKGFTHYKYFFISD